MKFSFLIPTRQRPDSLRKSLSSIEDNFDTSLGDSFEFLIAVDEDDDSYTDFSVIKMPRYGYAGIHQYYNGLCKLATGDWFWIWNDDCLITTKNWNAPVHSFADQFLVLNPKTNLELSLGGDTHVGNGCAFPLIPARWVRLLGYCSINRHVDCYVYAVGRIVGIIKNLDVSVLHDRFDLTGNNNDLIYQDSRPILAEYDFNRLFRNGDQANQVQIDARKIVLSI